VAGLRPGCRSHRAETKIQELLTKIIRIKYVLKTLLAAICFVVKPSSQHLRQQVSKKTKTLTEEMYGA